MGNKKTEMELARVLCEFKLNGKNYITKDTTNDCDGCAFEGRSQSCISAPFCTPEMRKDGREVIWVEKE